MAESKFTPYSLPNAPIPDPGVLEVSAKLEPGSYVLYWGVGNGRNPIHLAKAGHEVVAIDNSEEQLMEVLDMAQSIRSPRMDLHLETGDMREPSFKLETFDAVFLPFVLQELDTKEEVHQVIETAQHITVPGGINFVKACIGEPHEEEIMKDMVILSPGEVEVAYVAEGWGVEAQRCMDEEVPIVEREGKRTITSYDQVIAVKPS